MNTMNINSIRNFSIIAHIDHGKSTIADRILELTHAIDKRVQVDQVLDDMDLERERGITIKAHPVRLKYCADNGEEYILNLIDTPGHVDFSYEVSRSLSACEGALLIVDAAQGVEAQTVSNVHLALEQGLTIIPVINKIDLPNANVDLVKQQIEEILCIPAEEILLVSAKKNLGIREVLEAIVKGVPPPKASKEKELKALIFDSKYDHFRGAITYIRVVSGTIKKDMTIRMMSTGRTFDVLSVGVFKPKAENIEQLSSGEVGFITANIKVPSDVKIGDTVTLNKHPASSALAGFKEMSPMVFCGLFPVDANDYEPLTDAVNKLQLNDSAFMFEAENSVALGFGFRCGFLGLLHMEIIHERLQREFNLNIISTTPSVCYKVKLKDGGDVMIDNPVHFPSPIDILSIEEPFIKAFIVAPNEAIGAIMQLAQERRGACVGTESLSGINRVLMTFELPLNEVVIDFYDKLKSCTRGYASMDYELIDYRPSEIIKLDILINNDMIDAFSCLIHKDKAYYHGRQLAAKLKDVIPRHMIQVIIQATIGSKIIARETIRAMKKNVTAKCYGGDITRKRKLWEKQKEGKKKMKQFGTVTIPQNAFIEILKL
ncbi:MAG: translation elongation factor 4 [Candidatus Ancaeobacter aquaticus]|nr:translation elongation factor 4 [Candidatus Ancaeobacter aquaticus]